MNELEYDYEWFKYEGRILSNDYIKYILTKENKNKNKNEIIEMIKQIFNLEDLKKYYKLCISENNSSKYYYAYDMTEKSHIERILHIYNDNKSNVNEYYFNDNIYNQYLWLYDNLSRYILYHCNHERGLERLLNYCKDIKLYLNE